MNALSTRSFAEAIGDTAWWGRLVENAVGGHFCNTLTPIENSLTYWRDGVHEADFVVARGLDVWAIEVKSGRSGKTAGLARFQTRYPQAKAMLVGGSGIPLEEFFSRDAGAWLV